MALLTNHRILDGVVFLLLCIVFAAYLYMTRKFNYWKKRGVLEFSPSPFVGNFAECFFLKKSAGHFLKDLYDKTEGQRYMGFYIFDKPFLLIRDPELIKHVVVKDFNYFTDRYVSASETDTLGKSNLFLIKNPNWKILRNKLTPFFTSGKMKKMFELMIEIGYDLDNHMEQLGLDGKGRAIELKEVCAKYTTDIIGITAYGLRANSLSDPEAEFRKNGKNIFTFNVRRGIEMTSLFFAPILAKPFGFKLFSEKSSEFLREAFWDTINSRIASGAKRNDLIDLLIELKKSQENNNDRDAFAFDGDNLVSQAAIFFTAGFETSSTTMTTAMYELALQPDLQDRLRDEINEALERNGGRITYDMVTTLPYLDMVVSEALRMYPPLPFLDRTANADYKLPGSDLVIEKGTPVYIPMLGLHYDPRYFSDPEKFDPERFSDENKKKRPAYVYMPFGEGPHNCIGLRFGLLQTKLGLVHILSKYKLSTCAETMIPLRLNPKALITTADGGVFLNIQKISGKAA